MKYDHDVGVSREQLQSLKSIIDEIKLCVTFDDDLKSLPAFLKAKVGTAILEKQDLDTKLVELTNKCTILAE